jgi:hypothetical protein
VRLEALAQQCLSVLPRGYCRHCSRLLRAVLLRLCDCRENVWPPGLLLGLRPSRWLSIRRLAAADAALNRQSTC